MGRIFISYSHKDMEKVEPINEALTKAHILTWFDKKSIAEGDRWETNIITSISACNVFLVFHSKNYRDSLYCKKEWELITGKSGDISIVIIGLDDCVDSFIDNDIKRYQFLNYNAAYDDDQVLIERLTNNAAVKKCAVINTELPLDLSKGTPFFNAIQNMHKPSHHNVIETLMRFVLWIKQCEAKGQYISENADFSSLIAVSLDNNTLDLSLVGGSDFSDTFNEHVRNNYIRNVFYALFRFGRTDFFHTHPTNLAFETIFTKANHRFTGESSSDNRIDKNIYALINEKTEGLYGSFTDLDKLLEELSDIYNASKFYESQEVRYGGKYYEYTITPLVITVAKKLYELQNIRMAALNIGCIPKIKDSQGKTQDLFEICRDKNVFLQGQYGGGKSSILVHLFHTVALGLYIDLAAKSASRGEDIIQSLLSGYGRECYKINYNELYNFSAYNQEITLFVDNFDELSTERQNEVLAEISQLKNAFKIVIVSNRHDIEDNLSLTVSGDELSTFARYEICPLNKKEIIEFMRFRLSNIDDVDVNEIVGQFERIDENDSMFTLFDSFTKLTVLLDSVSDWSSFSVDELRTQFNSKIKVYQSIFEGSDEYSIQRKIASYFRGNIIDIEDVIMQLVSSEINLLKNISYESNTTAIPEEYYGKLRFKDYYPILTQNFKNYFFLNEEIRSYFVASYIISRIQEDIDMQKIQSLLGCVKDDYSVLKYLHDFDILKCLREKIYDIELLMEECEDYEELVYTLYKIIQYYDGELIQKEFLRYVKIKSIPDKFFFRAENITRIVVPPSVEVIGRAAFANMSILKEIDFAPENIGVSSTRPLKIKPWAILNCPLLEKIHLGSNYTNYVHPLFSRCYALKKLTVDDRNPAFTTSHDNCMLLSKDKTTLYCAVNNLSGEIRLPDGVRCLEDNSLSYLKNVTSIFIPAEVEQIATNFTDFCDRLEKIEVDKDNKNFYSDENGLMYTHSDGKKILFRAPSGMGKDLVIPEGVDIIGSDSISCCINVENIFIPQSVSEIENYAFADTYSLKIVRFERIDNITRFGNYIFLSTNNLAKIVGNEELDLNTFNSVYCKPKTDGKMRGVIRKPITVDIFTKSGFELIREGKIKNEYKAAAIVRDITLFNDKVYGPNDFNMLLIGLTEYNAIITKSKLEANRYVADLIAKNNISMVVMSRDLPLVSQFEAMDKYSDLMILRSNGSSTSATKKLAEVIAYLGEK